MHVNEKLKVVRRLRGWSQEQMAEKLGYSVNGYGKIERGETDVKVEQLKKIADTLGVELTRLITFNDNNMFNVIELYHSGSNNNIVLTETQCAHELEKAESLLRERQTEIDYLKQQVMQLQETNNFLKTLLTSNQQSQQQR